MRYFAKKVDCSTQPKLPAKEKKTNCRETFRPRQPFSLTPGWCGALGGTQRPPDSSPLECTTCVVSNDSLKLALLETECKIITVWAYSTCFVSLFISPGFIIGFFKLLHILPGTTGSVFKFWFLPMAFSQLDRQVAELDALREKIQTKNVPV